MAEPLNQMEVVASLVRAHEHPHPRTGHRESILFIAHMGGAHLQHHGFEEGERPDLDEADLDELSGLGLIDLDYSGNTLKFTPTARARNLVEQHERVTSLDPVADLAPLLQAIAQQAQAGNKLGWPAVRPVLAELRSYWEAGGFSPHGIQVPAILDATPADHDPLFVATMRALVAGGYLEPTSDLVARDLPVEVQLGERAHSVLDGWPGASPDDLFQNFLAVLDAQASAETDPVKRGRLEQIGAAVKELGVQTASEVLAKVITGG